MPPFLIPVLLVLGAGGFVGYGLYKKKHAGAAALQIASQVATRGPRGENVFRPELAESLVRMLASMVYAMPEAGNRRFIKASSSPGGAPVQREMSAYGWAESLNKTQSILAMMNLATANKEDKFLRAVDPGDEARYAGQGGLYAVLLYAGTLDRRLAPPGAPPSGAAMPGGTTPPLPVPMDDQTKIRDELGNDALAGAVIDLLKSGQNPDEMDRVANEIERDGGAFTASLLRKRANQIRASIKPTYEPPQPRPPGVVTPPYVPPPSPEPVPQPTPPSGGVEIAYVVATVTDPLTLRAAPNGTPIGALPKGSTFRSTRQEGGWAYGISDAIGKSGWASLQFLRESGSAVAPSAPSPTSSGTRYVVATASDSLNLRSSPSPTASIVGSLPRGSGFVVDTTQSGFAHGRSESTGATGWASLTYLRAA